MSEIHARPVAPRGRGSSRGGRGGFSTRGGRGGRGAHATNGEKADIPQTASIEDDGEVGQLKKKYGSKVEHIKDIFPGWTDEDAVMALEETNGDLESTVDQISTGVITQWGEVSKNKKDKSKSKSKDVTTTTSTLIDVANTRNPRGGRGAFEGSRGARGRGSDRGRGAARGGRGASVAHTNGTRTKESQPGPATVEDAGAWDNAKPEAIESKTAVDDTWETPSAVTQAETAPVSSLIPEGVTKSWADMFKAKPPPPPQEVKKAPVPVEKHDEEIKSDEPVEMPAAEPIPVEEPISEELPEPAVETTPIETPAYESEPNITPSKDELTETNLEQVLDTSNPAPTATAASTAASSWDPRSAGTTANSYSTLQQQAGRTPVSGYAATALKATGAGTRSASFQRRVLDQEEAVRMPGNREIDRTSVQFGAFNLNGSGEEDIDGDREEPETRAQPPLHSPVAPRASLPPAPPQTQMPVPESQPSPLNQARAPLPAAQPTSAPGLPSPQGLPSAQNSSQQVSQGTPYGQYNQYGSAGAQQEQHSQKYEAFAQQAPASQSPFDGHPSQQAQSQAPPQQPQSTFTSGPGEYSPYYASEAQHRNNYSSYYGGAPYGQQPGGISQQEGAPGLQQRTASGFNGTQNDTASPYPQSSAAQQTQSRYATAGEAQTSGHSTPNPVAQAQQQQPSQGAPTQSQHQPQGQAGGYQPYGPYSPYYAAYMNQYQQQQQQGAYGQYGQGGYGAPYGGKGGIYNQPHTAYGMSPTPFDHTSSPAAGSFAQSTLHGRDSAIGGGLGEYGRGAAGQSSTPQALGGGGGFGMHDTFGRNSSYQGQAQHYGQQPNQPSVGDDLKPFGDSKSANGPSPSLSHANRPTSAANNGLQSTLPPPQASQQGYGGYPSHLQQQHGLHGSQTNNQYGGLGVGHQAAVGQGHQGSTYGQQYPGFGGGSSYYGGGNNQRGGWGGNYGQH